jgi:tetratricopeptide (TPR) repeat protein
MSFDKLQAMRNAERHVMQGKLRPAIAEYKSVVEHDPRDFATMNMLGDLYLKNSEKKQALECYRTVADHYHKQGFSQKAIAIYKKIAKIDPSSVEISAKLAELYQQKGSLSEARSHYTTLAEHYRSQGKMIEALTIWKQIAVLDPNDTEVFVNLAEAYLSEKQEEEAADAYAEAAARLARAGDLTSAAANYECCLGLNPTSLKALEGLVKVRAESDSTEAATEIVREFLERQPNSREAICLLIDTYLAAGDAAGAEPWLIRLVELEPANYNRFLELVRIYVDSGDFVSATRALSLCIENLLVSGQKEECRLWITQILDLSPEQPGALRMLARLASWERNDAQLIDALTRLVPVAQAADDIDDERYALSQLVMIQPAEAKFADRLRELNEKYGYSENPYDEELLRGQFEDQVAEPAEPQQDGLEFLEHSAGHAASVEAEPSSENGFNEFEIAGLERGDGVGDADTPGAHSFGSDGSDPSEDSKIEKEVDSIRFYIQNGYIDLASSAINELKASYGPRDLFDVLQDELSQAKLDESTDPDPVVAADPIVQPAAVVETERVNRNGHHAKRIEVTDLRSEFGVDELDVEDDSDYETHYQMAVAYQEMGLMEEAIKEFQDAIALVSPGDAKRRFCQCANLMGHCFMQNGMSKHAVKWFSRALETPELNIDEKMGIWYELGAAFESDGDIENAGKFFEYIYAEDVDYRNVSQRIKQLTVHA